MKLKAKSDRNVYSSGCYSHACKQVNTCKYSSLGCNHQIKYWQSQIHTVLSTAVISHIQWSMCVYRYSLVIFKVKDNFRPKNRGYPSYIFVIWQLKLRHGRKVEDEKELCFLCPFLWKSSTKTKVGELEKKWGIELTQLCSQAFLIPLAFNADCCKICMMWHWGELLEVDYFTCLKSVLLPLCVLCKVQINEFTVMGHTAGQHSWCPYGQCLT